MADKTGWPPGLLQDDSRGLSRWFASRIDARLRLREAMSHQAEIALLVTIADEIAVPITIGRICSE